MNDTSALICDSTSAEVLGMAGEKATQISLLCNGVHIGIAVLHCALGMACVAFAVVEFDIVSEERKKHRRRKKKGRTNVVEKIQRKEEPKDDSVDSALSSVGISGTEGGHGSHLATVASGVENTGRKPKRSSSRSKTGIQAKIRHLTRVRSLLLLALREILFAAALFLKGVTARGLDTVDGVISMVLMVAASIAILRASERDLYYMTKRYVSITQDLVLSTGPERGGRISKFVQVFQIPVLCTFFCAVLVASVAGILPIGVLVASIWAGSAVGLLASVSMQWYLRSHMVRLYAQSNEILKNRGAGNMVEIKKRHKVLERQAAKILDSLLSQVVWAVALLTGVFARNYETTEDYLLYILRRESILAVALLVLFVRLTKNMSARGEKLKRRAKVLPADESSVKSMSDVKSLSPVREGLFTTTDG